MIFAILTDISLPFVPAQGLSHVKGIFRGAPTGWVIAIVSYDSAIHTIARGPSNDISIRIDPEWLVWIGRCLPHLLVHIDCGLIRDSDKKIHEPSIFLLTCSVQLSGQLFRKAHLAVLRCNGESGDMAMPGEISVAHDLQVLGILFDFSHDCAKGSVLLWNVDSFMGHPTIGNDLTPLVLSDDEHGRPFCEVVKIELPSIVLGEWIKITEVQLRYVCRGA